MSMSPFCEQQHLARGLGDVAGDHPLEARRLPPSSRGCVEVQAISFAFQERSLNGPEPAEAVLSHS